MLFHAWRGVNGRLAEASSSIPHEDTAVFAEWAARYRARLDALDAFDTALLPDVLAGIARPGWIRPLGGVVLHGFIALTPQQQRLLAALRTAGMPIDEIPAARIDAATRMRTSMPTPAEELVQALCFARARVEAAPDARVGIVVADLDARRDEVIALAEEILCPERLLSL